MQIIFADKDHKLPGSDDFLNKRKLLHFPGDSSEMLLQSMGKILSGKSGTNESLTTAAVYEISGIIHCSSVVLGIFTAVKKHLANERIISLKQNKKCLYP